MQNNNQGCISMEEKWLKTKTKLPNSLKPPRLLPHWAFIVGIGGKAKKANIVCVPP